MDEKFSQIVKIRFNKITGDYSVVIPFEFRELAKSNKYLECTQDSEGRVVYAPLKK